jgi:hypothetical protein
MLFWMFVLVMMIRALKRIIPINWTSPAAYEQPVEVSSDI